VGSCLLSHLRPEVREPFVGSPGGPEDVDLEGGVFVEGDDNLSKVTVYWLACWPSGRISVPSSSSDASVSSSSFR